MTSLEFERRALRPLRRLARRLRGYLLLDGLAAVMVVMAAAAGAQVLLDWLWHLPVDMRAALLAAGALGIVLAAWRKAAGPLAAGPDLPAVAMRVEAKFPHLQSLLISAVRFHRGDVGPAESNSPALMEATLQRAVAAVPNLRLTGIPDHRRARRSSGLTVAVVAAFTAAFALAPQTMGLWFERCVLLGDTAWPRKTRIVVELADGVLRGARGDDLEVRAFVPTGYQAPGLVDIVYTFESGKTGRRHMVRVGQRGYRHTFIKATDNFRFHLEGGDDRTEEYRAELTDRPAVERAAIDVVPPAYTRLEPYRLGRGRRSAAVLPGSTVTLSIETNKPVRQACLMADSQRLAEAVGRGRTWRVTLQPARSQTLHFALTDELGLQNKRPARFGIRLLKDEAPRVRLKLPGAGGMVTTEAVLPVELELSDDYGLGAAELVYQIMGEGETDHTLALSDFDKGAKRHEQRMGLAVSSLPVLAGDRITLFARATDLDDVSGPNEGSSTAVTLRVVTRDELLAELSRREQEYRREFERAVGAQEDLRRLLLTAVDRLGDHHNEAPTQFARAERGQRLIAGQVNGVRQQFERVLTRMRVNGLETEVVRRRVGDGIVAPLTRLTRRELASAADAIRRLAHKPDAQRASTIDPQQVRILADMQAALANMLKWEGFQETVTMLREILRRQAELKAETAEEIERQAAEIFADD